MTNNQRHIATQLGQMYFAAVVTGFVVAWGIETFKNATQKEFWREP